MANILVAEDERDIRELINFTLSFAGHRVTAVSNGAEAVTAVVEVKPDLILLDVRMPKVTGYDACRQIKQIDQVKNIPVVFLSAKGQEQEIAMGKEAGAVDYILKPFAPEELVRRIAEILQEAGAHQPPHPSISQGIDTIL